MGAINPIEHEFSTNTSKDVLKRQIKHYLNSKEAEIQVDENEIIASFGSEEKARTEGVWFVGIEACPRDVKVRLNAKPNHTDVSITVSDEFGSNSRWGFRGNFEDLMKQQADELKTYIENIDDEEELPSEDQDSSANRSKSDGEISGNELLGDVSVQKWWLHDGESVSDKPYAKDELEEMDEFLADTKVCQLGTENWQPAHDVDELRELVRPQTGPNFDVEDGDESNESDYTVKE